MTWFKRNWPAGVWVAALIGAIAATALGQQTRRSPGRPGQGGRRTLQVGQPAPDFDLPLLVEGKDAEGNAVNRITGRKVKLSSFRHKRIVCVFFSSYT